MRLRPVLTAAGLTLLAACQTQPQAETRSTTLSTAALPQPETAVPGFRADGSVLLPNQWSLRPVGVQVAVGDFPENIAIHPKGEFAAVLHCGYGPHEIAILNLKTHTVVTRYQVAEAFYGIAFSPDGSQLVASGAGKGRDPLEALLERSDSGARGDSVARCKGAKRSRGGGV